MTVEEFLVYIGTAKNYCDKGKTRWNRAHRAYAAYVAAYREQSLLALCRLARQRGPFEAVLKAAEDRDAGRPMVQVPELL